MKKLIVSLCILFQISVFAELVQIPNLIIDKENKLMWQDDDDALYQENITMAKVYCDSMILNGYNDWYLPTMKQYHTIIDITNQKGYIKKEFVFFKSEKYWSDTPYVNNKQLYWFVDFKTAKHNYMSKDIKNFVRCVRDIVDE